jgi:hypothetical protein
VWHGSFIRVCVYDVCMYRQMINLHSWLLNRVPLSFVHVAKSAVFCSYCVLLATIVNMFSYVDEFRRLELIQLLDFPAKIC